MKKILLAILLVFCLMANAQTPNFWHEKATGFTDADKTLNSISIVDANTIWANEFDFTNQDYTLKTFTRSTDAGETWTTGSINLEPIPADGSSIGLGISSISAASASTAWISVYPDSAGTGGIWNTIDNGVSWQKQTTTQFSDPASYTDFVHFWDANNGVALGDAVGDYFEIYTTNDGGATWNTASSPIATGDFSFFNGYAVSGDSVWVGTSLGGILKSTDKGLNWTFLTALPAGTDFIADRFTFSDTNKGLLLLVNTQQIYKTVDGGTTWTEVVSITNPNSYKTNLNYIPGTSTIIATSEASPNGSSYSTDDGVTWTTIDSSFHGESAFLNDTFGFSAGATAGTTGATTGGIYKFSGIPLKTASFDTNNQIAVYPNPTNGLLQINSKAYLVKEATVYDLLGKKVYSSKISASNNVSLDLKSLQTGIYTLKVTSDTGKSENIKIIKN